MGTVKIMLLYRSRSLSNRVVSSTVEKARGTDLEIIGFNVDKRNLDKYIEENELPSAIYKYKEDKILVNVANVRIEEYTREIAYKPSRVPGNKLKTRVYGLLDKIVTDIETDFEKITTYRVNRYGKDIVEIRSDIFSKMYPRFTDKRLGKSTLVEAEAELNEYLDLEVERNISKIRNKICEIEDLKNINKKLVDKKI